MIYSTYKKDYTTMLSQCSFERFVRPQSSRNSTNGKISLTTGRKSPFAIDIRCVHLYGSSKRAGHRWAWMASVDDWFRPTPYIESTTMTPQNIPSPTKCLSAFLGEKETAFFVNFHESTDVNDDKDVKSMIFKTHQTCLDTKVIYLCVEGL